MLKQKSILAVLVLLIAASLACSMPLTPVATPTATSTQLSTSTPTTINTTNATISIPVPLVTVTTQPVSTSTTQPPAQTVQAVPTATTNSASCNLATFEGDVTYVDDTVVPAGTSFVKKWRLGNAGSCIWTSGYKVIFVSGDAMGVTGTTQLTNGTVPPGSSVEAAVSLVAPAAAGTYQGNFKIQSSDGTVFGIGSAAVGVMYVRIIVEGQNAQAESNKNNIIIPIIPKVIPTLSRNLKLTSPYMTGSDVTQLQKRLIARGYTIVGSADGIFGKKTETGVKQFQADQGLNVDGIVGKKTWAALWS